jgi:hypothetical protein
MRRLIVWDPTRTGLDAPVSFGLRVLQKPRTGKKADEKARDGHSLLRQEAACPKTVLVRLEPRADASRIAVSGLRVRPVVVWAVVASYR